MMKIGRIFRDFDEESGASSIFSGEMHRAAPEI
jgi:hypothetical protein